MKPKIEPEPWLRGTLTELSPISRAVLHALELAREDVERWAEHLTDSELDEQPDGLASVARQIRHIIGSIDRLLTYAEGRQLSEEQMQALKSEGEPVPHDALFAAFRAGLEQAGERVRRFTPSQFAEPRAVGRKQLPTTVGGLLVHVADHTQRHVGQLVTTVKVIMARSGQEQH